MPVFLFLLLVVDCLFVVIAIVGVLVVAVALIIRWNCTSAVI